MTIKDEFDKRVIEINLYYEILAIIELNSPQICANRVDIEEAEPIAVNLSICSDKVDILRSTAYLLLYNLIESTVYNSIISIFDQITDQNIQYIDMIEELQKYLLNNIYKHDNKKNKKTIIETIMTIVKDVFNNTIKLVSKNINYGGTLDADIIFDTAKLMAIDTVNLLRIYRKNTHGNTLRDIRQKRNWLAHGDKTFKEVGSLNSFIQLETSKNLVIEFLEQFIASVESYILHAKFKK